MPTNDAADIDQLAERFVERCADAWARPGLPRTVLASACLTWGLQEATLCEGPEAVAEGLERMAASIRQAGDPLTVVRH